MALKTEEKRPAPPPHLAEAIRSARNAGAFMAAAAIEDGADPYAVAVAWARAQICFAILPAQDHRRGIRVAVCRIVENHPQHGVAVVREKDGSEHVRPFALLVSNPRRADLKTKILAALAALEKKNQPRPMDPHAENGAASSRALPWWAKDLAEPLNIRAPL